MSNSPSSSALKVSMGVQSGTTINPRFLTGGQFKRPQLDIDELFSGIVSGERGALSRAITLVESSKVDHQDLARNLINQCISRTGQSIRVGITGVPGVGKSTFIEAFGMYLIEKQNKKVAVLAVDPSSNRSGGSILGDKTRMAQLSNHPFAFIRPSPSSCSLGGVARKTRETVLLCEAAGFDCILIETVGVGQSETTVRGMVDFFLLLMLAGAGDELQGIKRGIMEMADGLVITKADGDNGPASRRAMAEYQGALHHFPAQASRWAPRVGTCSALTGVGIGEVWDMVLDFKKCLETNGCWINQRSEQLKSWMRESIEQQLVDQFYQHPGMDERFKQMEIKVSLGQSSPFESAHSLLQWYRGYSTF